MLQRLIGRDDSLWLYSRQIESRNALRYFFHCRFRGKVLRHSKGRTSQILMAAESAARMKVKIVEFPIREFFHNLFLLLFVSVRNHKAASKKACYKQTPGEVFL